MKRCISPRGATHIAVAQALADGATCLSEIISMSGIPQTTAYASLRALIGRQLVGRKQAVTATGRATYWLTGSIEDVRKAYEAPVRAEFAGPWNARELEQAWPAVLGRRW